MHKKTITLSKKRDSDLIALRNTIGSRDFTRLLKDSSRAIVRADHANTFCFPENAHLSRTEAEVEKDVRFEVGFGEKDADVASLVEHVKPGKFNAFVKNAIRMYVGTSILSAYLDESFEGATRNAQTVRVVYLGKVAKKASTTTTKKRKRPSTPRPKTEKQPSFQPVPTFSTPASPPAVAFTEELDNVGTPVGDEDDVLSLLGGLID